LKSPGARLKKLTITSSSTFLLTTLPSVLVPGFLENLTSYIPALIRFASIDLPLQLNRRP
jgi:hypothetical protein